MKRIYASSFVIGVLACCVALVIVKLLSLQEASQGTSGALGGFRGNTHNKYAQATVQPVTFYAQCAQNSDKMIARKGIIFRKPGARATVMICHGFMCDKTDIRFMRMLFHDYNVMLFDFRAHGECRAGQECTFGYDEVYDILAAGSLIKSDPELGKLPLIVYGFSMGAVSSIHAQAKNEKLFDCAIWDCPFESTDALLDRSIENLTFSCCGYVFGLPGRGLLKKYAYNYYIQQLVKYLLNSGADMDGVTINTNMVPLDTVKFIEKVSIPALFITCRNDQRAPPYAVRKVYDRAQGYKRLWITNGRRHFDSFFYNPEKYTYKVQTFIQRFLDGTLDMSVPEKIYQDEPEIN